MLLKSVLNSETGLNWRWVNEQSIHKERSPQDKEAFTSKSRGGIQGGELYSGLDIFIFERANPTACVRVKVHLLEEVGRYTSPNYNIPSDIRGNDREIVEGALQLLATHKTYFLTVLKKVTHFVFWLDKYSNYPPSEYLLSARFKNGRKDRLTLKVTNNNLKHFNTEEQFIKKIKAAIHENTNFKTS